MPYDALCIGNHELGDGSVADYLADNVRPFWNGKYLGGNVQHKNTNKTICDVYRKIPLKGRTGNILVVGYLYSMTNACDNVNVVGIKSYLKESTFGEVLNDTSIKLIVHLCHISTDSSEVQSIYSFFNSYFPNVTQVLLTGHSHQTRSRNNFTSSANTKGFAVAYAEENAGRQSNTKKITAQACAVESGCYLRNVGHMVFDLPLTESTTAPTVTFTVDWLYANKPKLQTFSNVSEANWATEVGTEIDTSSSAKFEELNLSSVLGCAPQKYFKKQYASDGQVTVFRLMVDTAYPSYRKSYRPGPEVDGITSMFCISYSGLRSHIYEGEFILDDIYTVDPFNNDIVTVEDVSGADIKKLFSAEVATSSKFTTAEAVDRDYGYEYANSQFETASTKFTAKYAYTNITYNTSLNYDIVATSYDVGRILTALNKVASKTYTTVDTGLRTRDVLAGYVKKCWSCNGSVEPDTPTPIVPTPVDPTPVNPNVTDPTPVNPNVTDPTPVEPTPVEPTPVNPNGTEPTPVEPGQTNVTTSAGQKTPHSQSSGQGSSSTIVIILVAAIIGVVIIAAAVVVALCIIKKCRKSDEETEYNVYEDKMSVTMQ